MDCYLKMLAAKDLRAVVDERNEKIGKKIRDNEMKKIPYMLIVGEKEVEEKSLSVRLHGGKDLGKMSGEALIELLQEEIRKQLE